MIRICLFLNGQFELSNFKIKIKNKIITPLHLKTKHVERIQNYAADGGLNYLLKYKFSTDNLSWAGDSDSLNNKSKLFLKKNKMNNLHLYKRKDFSDLGAILDIILQQKLQDNVFLEIYGGLGKRRDHEKANIEEIKRFINSLPGGGTAYFHGGVIISSLPIKFLQSTCRFFSIFANNTAIEIEGALYSGHFTLDRPSHGLSNEVTRKTFSITPLQGAISIYLEE